RKSVARRDGRRLPDHHRVGSAVRFVLVRVTRRRDLELELLALRAAALLNRVRDLVREQVLASGRRRIELTRAEVNVVARRVRLRADRVVGRGGLAASVDADAGEVGAERTFELTLEVRGEWRAARRGRGGDRRVRALGDTV